MTTAQNPTLSHAAEAGDARKSRRWGHLVRDRAQPPTYCAGTAGTILATAFGTPLLYLFASGSASERWSTPTSARRGVGGVTYLEFVAPALICAAAITVASEEFTLHDHDGVSSGTRSSSGMNAAPISGRQIINGVALFVAIRMAATCAIYFVVMLLFGAVPSAWGWLTVPIAVLTGFGFGFPLLAYSASLTDDKGQFAMVMRFIVLPMTLFSGTVFPLSTLPIWLQWIGWISPPWHGTQLAREDGIRNR